MPTTSETERRPEAARIGMWVFLMTEAMLFGGLFAVYAGARAAHPEGFAAAGERTDLIMGTANTAILLTSSLTMALAVRAAKEGRGIAIAARLLATVLLGAAFLAIKGLEYSRHLRDRDALLPKPGGLFFALYFAMTGLHALHMAIGIVLLLIVAVLAVRGRFTAQDHSPVELAGLYWHFVDMVWIFLFPMFYLAKARG